MATRIIEYGGSGVLAQAFPVVPADQFVLAQTAMTTGVSSAQSAAFNAATQLICVQSDEATFVRVGLNPTATHDHYRLQAGTENFFSVALNAGWKVAIIT